MIFDAVILAGGRSSRLGGTPKAQLVMGGETLLELTLRAVRDARQIVIVGDSGSTPVPPTTIVTRENPPFGGPAAAIAAGLAATTGFAADWVLVLACDMPGVSGAVDRLLSAATGDGVFATDDHGREQYLLACYRRSALEAAIARQPGVAGLSVRALVADLAMTTIAIPTGAAADIDTWDDAARFGIPAPAERAP